ncbi:hypothetical protein [Mitsuaria sp. 7]|uniref:hypothetical protein n=1 Tax=Mitsuaria sp. 7 TaxID=1658665 RepID=UPI0007DCF35C|nr:hypothetical protein [Mitsuaria sp. 7]ANH69618.1 hypothetical protein ABE85_22215 [Mitsuaria sp. 7]
MKPINKQELDALNVGMVKRFAGIYVGALLCVVLFLSVDIGQFIEAPSQWIPAIRRLRENVQIGATTAAFAFVSWAAILLWPAAVLFCVGARLYERSEYVRRTSSASRGSAPYWAALILWALLAACYFGAIDPLGSSQGSHLVAWALRTSAGLIVVGPLAFVGMTIIAAFNLFITFVYPFKRIFNREFK